MTSREEEELWRSIVENYGERARLDTDEGPGSDQAPSPTVPEAQDPYATPVSSAPPGQPLGADVDQEPADDEDDPDERFVPPEPEPLPPTSWRRRLAWTAVLGAPTLILVLALLGATISAGTGVALAAAFVGAFGYLVSTMERGPRHPWDDGSAV